MLYMLHPSVDSMVLIRKILQYNPIQRPSIGEILEDPWITGKRPIPRQINRPKWVNPYEGRKEEPKDVRVQRPSGGANGKQPQALYYKAAVSERTQDSTVTLSGNKRETVTLKSRSGPKKNIWASGPQQHQRPHTWPTASYRKDYKRYPGNRCSGSPRANPRGHQRTSTTGSYKHGDDAVRNGEKTHAEYRRVSERSNAEDISEHDSEEKNKHITKWFLEKYLKPEGREEVDKNENKPNAHVTRAGNADSKRSNSCGCDMDAVGRIQSMAKQHFCSDISFDAVPPMNEDQSGVRPPPAAAASCSKKNSLCSDLQKRVASPIKTNGSCKSIRKNVNTTATDKDCSSRSPMPVKKVTVEASRSPSPKEKKPSASRSMDICNTMAQKSAANRVKHFREKLLELYGCKTKCYQDGSELPPLVAQAIKPPKNTSSNNNTPTTVVHVKDPYVTMETRRQKRYYKARPLQRVIIHAT